MKEKTEQKHINPPMFFYISVGLALAFHFFFPAMEIVSPPYTYLGIVLIVLGIWLNIWADRLFKVNKTPVKPHEKPSSLIRDGPFHFSRNPMYLGMVLILLGIAIFLGTASIFIPALFFFLIMELKFIPLEEKFMEEVFGENFIEYRKRVRKWL